MSDTKASKDWAPFSKQIKLDESDWAVVDALFEEHRNREGVISKADFIRKLLLTGARSQLLYLHQHSPASLTDRKSTRLNSSHSQISYAVFCLKKKNI